MRHILLLTFGGLLTIGFLVAACGGEDAVSTAPVPTVSPAGAGAIQPAVDLELERVGDANIYPQLFRDGATHRVDGIDVTTDDTCVRKASGVRANTWEGSHLQDDLGDDDPYSGNWCCPMLPNLRSGSGYAPLDITANDGADTFRVDAPHSGREGIHATKFSFTGPQGSSYRPKCNPSYTIIRTTAAETIETNCTVSRQLQGDYNNQDYTYFYAMVRVFDDNGTVGLWAGGGAAEAESGGLWVRCKD